MNPWWRNEPVPFACQPGCTECCRAPGVVFFDREDIRRAAKGLNLTPAKFKAEYLQFEDGQGMIEVTKKTPCPFLTETGCRIHPFKPKQCETFPFWPENMESKSAWKKVARKCPGIGEGPAVPVETMEDLLGK